MRGGKFAAVLAILMSFATAHGAFAQAAEPASAASAAVRARVQIERDCRAPVYPANAEHTEAQGITTIQFSVAATGKLTASEIAQSAGSTTAHKLLDQAAMEALARCPFTPAHDENGNAQADTIKVEYVWTLEPPAAEPPPVTPR